MILNSYWVMFLYLLPLCCVASANLVLIGKNITLFFDDTEANFAPPINDPGVGGVLYLSEPLDACSDLSNRVEMHSNGSFAFVLIARGGCSFQEKVGRAQKAGFKAAIVYENHYDGILITMDGNSDGISIHAVFISKASGEILTKYAGSSDVELWLIPSFENSAWSLIAVSFISILAMSAVLATCFFVRRHHIRRRRPRASRSREFHGMSSRLVKAMPSLVFTTALEDNCTSRTCAICLEDYVVGEKLRILPCRHKFHALCVDSWLTTWRTFCPVCKRDARTNTIVSPPSENTPLLPSSPATVSPSVLSSFRSSLRSSSALQISRGASRSPSPPHSPYFEGSRISQSSIDVTDPSFHSPPNRLVFPSIAPSLSTSYTWTYRPSPNESPTRITSSINHYSKSSPAFSPFASSHSLPEC